MSAAGRVVLAITGCLAVLLGAALATRPFQSLAVLTVMVAAGLIVIGVGEVVNRASNPSPRTAAVLGIAWIAAGIGVLVWPGLPLRSLALVVGVVLLVSGVARLVGVIRGTTDERARSGLLGAAGVLLGILAIGWPDVTSLIVGVLFGVWLVLKGIGWVIDAIANRAPGTGAGTPPGRIRRWGRTLAAGAALLIALALGSASLSLHAGEPQPDAFYATPSGAPGAPGTLIRAEPFTRALPAGAQAWRILSGLLAMTRPPPWPARWSSRRRTRRPVPGRSLPGRTGPPGSTSPVPHLS